MPFTGKATYSAGSTLPEIADDVSDIVSIVSPYETPLLDHLGDPARAASSTYHEWLEDSLIPNMDVINDTVMTDPANKTTITMTNGSRFRVGDQIRPHGSLEILYVTNVTNNVITVTRGYGATPKTAIANGQTLHIIGNAALEGDDAPLTRFTSRVRKGNWTQIFVSTVRVSGSDLAVRKLAVSDELDYQKQERLREMLRDLESTVLCGRSPLMSPEGSSTVRRTMMGILPSITTNVFKPSVGGFPNDTALTEAQLNLAMRRIWEGSSARVDTIVVGGFQKRRINGFIASGARNINGRETTYRDLVSVYESDFGVCRIILSRSLPADSVLLLDSSRVSVMPLNGRHFHYKPLATTGDYEAGEVIGEYTVELRNEIAHGIITGLDAS
ncbi:MAG: DUF5309 domain-containing protein [Phycisphaerae bacterium]|nr:DUF5309 domain-containing protein [Phycisphaerae bacterium]